MRTDQEIRKELDAAYDVTMEGGSNLPGMSYEEGVVSALSWALEDNNDRPVTDE